MNTKVDSSRVVPVSQMQGDDAEDTAKLTEMLKEAKGFLSHFSWCKDIKEEYFGMGVGGIVGVYLFKIQPAKPEVDEWLWVIVGDLPPAYIVVDKSPNPASALNSYIKEMSGWVLAAKKGKSVDNLIPVNVPPTIENAKLLESRLKFLNERILCCHKKEKRK